MVVGHALRSKCAICEDNVPVDGCGAHDNWQHILEVMHCITEACVLIGIERCSFLQRVLPILGFLLEEQ